MFARNAFPIWIGIIALLLMCSTGAFAQTTWIVDQVGGGDFTTIQGCIDDVNVLDGDTCLVNPGTYVENINLSGKPIIVASAEGAEHTIIDGGGSGMVVYIHDSGSFITMQGFTIRNGGDSLSGKSGLVIMDAWALVGNCVISDNAGTGIYASLGSDLGDQCYISNCYVANNEVGIQAVAGSNWGGVAVIIKNTIVTGNGVGFQGLQFEYKGMVEVYNCTIAANTTFELGTPVPPFPNALIVNSIIWGEDPGLAAYYDIRYSDVKGGHPGEGNININPFFAGADDFHLSPFSLCIDRGVDTAMVIDDYDGNVRPQGSGYDMGAYEFIPGSEWSVPEAQAATMYGTPEEAEKTSRNNLLVALLLIPGLVVLVLKRLVRVGIQHK